MTATIYTIGHSTRPLDEFLALLTRHRLAALADVRRYPRSRRHPQFNDDALARALAEEGIHYVHIPALGGRREGAPDSPNTAWRNASFRAYADHMASAEFRAAIDALLAGPAPTAVMCAEAVPWRCHRNLIADELTRRGLEVRHIVSEAPPQLHKLNPAAVDAGTHLVYPAGGQGHLGFPIVE